MIDIETAFAYLKQTVEVLELKQDELHAQELELENKKRQLVDDRAALTASKSSFYAQTDEMTSTLNAAEKMRDLSAKMKMQIDEDRSALTIREQVLSDRESKIPDLEKKQSELEKKEIDQTERARLLGIYEEDVSNRELLLEKNMQATRTKQSDLALREKAITAKQEQLQAMIDAQKL